MITLVLNRMKLWQKLGWLVLAMAIPATLVGFFYLRLANGQVSQARDELDGVRYLQVLSLAEGEILTHRSRAFVFLSGDAARKNDVIAQADEVERQIASVDKINATVGKQLGVDSTWERVKAEWATVKAKTLIQTAADMDSAHAALIEHLQQLTKAVSVSSQTWVDPELTTHMLIRIASDQIPLALLYSNDLRRYAVRAAAKGYMGGDDRMGLQISRERFHGESSGIHAGSRARAGRRKQRAAHRLRGRAVGLGHLRRCHQEQAAHGFQCHRLRRGNLRCRRAHESRDQKAVGPEPGSRPSRPCSDAMTRSAPIATSAPGSASPSSLSAWCLRGW